MGPSIRKTPPRAEPKTGTRRIYGPDSRYRLEGTLLLYTFFDDEVIDSFSAYRKDLEATSDLVDIQSLPRNEQLAYWFNLHNVALLEQISSAWPKREPREIKIDGVPLDEAKFITVEGVSMSLKDIREEIVYRNWEDPKVIYGFWRGEFGSPALMREAWSGRNVDSLLDVAAADFINSLRGTQKQGKKLVVSRLYEETAPFFFADFENDVIAHVERYAEDEVAKMLTKTSELEAKIRDHDIADMSGGLREPTYTNLSFTSPDGTGGQYSFRVPYSMAVLLRQRQRKLEWMERREIPTGRVFLTEIYLPGDPIDKNEVK